MNLNEAQKAKLIVKTENGRGEEYLALLERLHALGSCGCLDCES